MNITATVTAKQIREALEEMGESLYDLRDSEQIDIHSAEIDDVEASIELGPCEECGGEGVPDPEPVVDANLIEDFIRSIRDGDLTTARAMVGRVFGEMSDVRIVDAAICRCAA